METNEYWIVFPNYSGNASPMPARKIKAQRLFVNQSGQKVFYNGSEAEIVAVGAAETTIIKIDKEDNK